MTLEKLEMLKNTIMVLATLATLAAAVFWAKAARVKVNTSPKSTASGVLASGSVIVENKEGRYLLFETLEKQALWNQRAASAAVVAAILTIILQLL